MSDTPAPAGPPPADPNPEEARKLAAEADKLAAEARKTNAEADRLARPWYRDPAMFASATPIVLALITLFAGIVSGYFSAERQRLEGATNQLRGDKAQLEGEKARLEGETEKLKADKTRLEAEKATLQKEITHVRDQGAEVLKEFNGTVTTLQELSDTKLQSLNGLINQIEREGGNSGPLRQHAGKVKEDLDKIRNQLANTKKKIDALPKFAPPPP